ncbi:hypothetical protein HB662_28665 [Roseomonas frigidaquae]|uniref:DNA-binding protein n=1 Tax=Falsiroseomonas frigidaquae TaxID=487318 RepID=A0ABX1F8Z5_9PROT|nr:hypothetical protein [Falsiroseomonas frigidaquae]NKE48772.1 hypothetical protein [Falsiroseomonas frigidaquae]
MSEFIPGQPHTFTLGEAAKAAGVSKPSLSKAISSGRISAERKPDGSYSIQAAELFRAYPQHGKGNGEGNPSNDATLTGVSQTANPQLAESEANGLREQLATEKAERERERRQLTDQIEDLRSRLDREGEDRRRLTAILTDQRARAEQAAPPSSPAPPVEPAPRSLWQNLFGWRG